MPDVTLVTLLMGKDQMDLELPLHQSIASWLPGLCSAVSWQRETPMLCLQGQRLDPDHTLAEYGVWDGSILTLS